jgi:hypothetical protein
MRRTFFIATVTFVLLASAASAGAVPRLIVFQSSYRPAASTTVDAALLQKNDRPPAKIVMTLQGGDIDVSKPPNTAVGEAIAVAKTASTSVFAGATVNFLGPILVADPADHLLDGGACTGSGLHDAVWVLQLAARGHSFPLTLYIDRNRVSLQGRWIVTLCPASPFVSQNEGGAPYGSALQDLFLHLTGVYRNGATHGVYHWWGLVTPYVTETATPDTNATVETRALMPIPYQLGLSRERAPAGSVRLAGTIHANSFGFTGIRLDVYAGTSKDRLRLVGRTSKVTKRGFYTFAHKGTARATYYQVVFGPVDVTKVPGDLFCGGHSDAPGGCVSATLSEIDSNVVRVAGARRAAQRA